MKNKCQIQTLVICCTDPEVVVNGHFILLRETFYFLIFATKIYNLLSVLMYIGNNNSR